MQVKSIQDPARDLVQRPRIMLTPIRTMSTMETTSVSGTGSKEVVPRAVLVPCQEAR